jgi:aldose 1-epimerase
VAPRKDDDVTTPSGDVLTLTAGDYRATVVSVGAGLAGLTWRDRHVVVGHDPGVLPVGYLGKTLVPWPNRITDGRYTFDGQTHEVPVNEHETNAALHGLASWVVWDVASATADEVSLTTDLVPRYGYPFWLRSTVTYRLDAAAGLTVSITSTNLGDAPAPYGASCHPYLSCDLAPVDECTLTAPGARVLEVDERLRPVGLRDVGGDLDLREPRPLGGRRVDHAYTALPGGGWTVELEHPGKPFRARMHADAPWVQIYSGEKVDRRGVAVEPMTCPPDAFNSGTDLVVLAPGEAHTLTFRIDAVPTA